MSPAADRRASGRGWGPWVPWFALALVVVVTLGVGTFAREDRTDAQRATDLAELIKCPQCDGQSVATSDNPSSQGIRILIAERIAAGDSDETIRDFVVTRYPGTALDPTGTGFTGLVWAVPVVVVVAALTGLVYRFRDWRPGAVAVTQADRDLVARALAPEPDADGGTEAPPSGDRVP